MNWLFGKITDITDEQYCTVYHALTPSRKAHIDRMKIEDDRKRSLMATFLLNKLLLSEGIQAEIETCESGKPFINGHNLHVSISHSDQAVVCALSDTPVGIDVEKIKPVSKKLIEYVCTRAEADYVLSGKETVDEIAINRFFEVWTAKEALFKKSGGKEKSIRSIDTLSLKKQVYVIDDYYITLL